MKNQNSDQVVTQILGDAPTARKALVDNYTNLLKVAQFCHDNYLQSGDNSTVALEETKNFTTQSLASIAYQISTLANNVLSLLEAQTNQLCRMESSINLIGQTVEMHKEKVSRREIGVFTSVRRLPRGMKVLPPASTPAGVQKRPTYSRQPINFQMLDHLGHGVKVSGKKDKTESICQFSASFRSNKAPEPEQCSVSPAGSSSFGKPVAPPTIPTTLLANPPDDIITSVLNDAPPLPAQDEITAQVDDFMNTPALPPPPPPPSDFDDIITPQPPSDVPPAPPLHLETVVEESSSLPPSPPPPPADEVMFYSLSNGDDELPAPPPPPPPQELDDLEIPLLPPPLSLDVEEFDDITSSFPPPLVNDSDAEPHYLEKVVALYSYTAANPEELTLTEGDVVYLTHRHSDGWCQGFLDGNQGFFPESYVQSQD
ncbi:ABI family, member 3a [Cynoglossus semilaevis]|uniref:ABI family, member 3a n=1 Tax=Cynoglossus semilaevis TaxID=244447 RepID=UPI000496D29F|nr:ABI gene family member 3-like [Cynoglossus semilaevis]XP_024920338.1 ABI gene family member 3-like [Cynoglossus semilaevis]